MSLGPGGMAYMAPAARKALEEAEVVVGYTTYMGLLDPQMLRGKEIISTGMRKEIERCRVAVGKAMEGRKTAIVCSGDAGVYGMAGLVLEILEQEGLLDRLEVEVVAGIPALCAAAALLGAPLMHDFAVISLSDLLTPWEVVQTRVRAAASADYVMVLYNPRSRSRSWQLGEVRKMVLEHRKPDTPVGIVRNAMREEQEVRLTTLERMDDASVDMLSIVIIGNSESRAAGTRMITPRGYGGKYGANFKG